MDGATAWRVAAHCAQHGYVEAANAIVAGFVRVDPRHLEAWRVFAETHGRVLVDDWGLRISPPRVLRSAGKERARWA